MFIVSISRQFPFESFFTLPSSAKTLQVSYIGMQNVEIAIKPNLRIVLKPDSQILDEVMVVAYGTVKKASFTGSASTVGSAEIASQKESLVKSLQGKVAGVRIGGSTGDPGSNQRILIRGISSYSASDQPLYVVDGVAITDDTSNLTSGLKSQSVLSSINPEDIENLTVLKDAAAASLYGSRAANGVIIITTKQGKAGKTKISYNMETGWTDIAVNSQYKPMSAQQMKEYYWHGIKNYFVVREGLSESEAAVATDEEVPEWFWNYDSNINTNWRKEVYKKGFATDHQISMSGGNDKTKFYAGFGYNKTDGIVKGSEFERFSGRLNLDHYAKDWLRVGLRQMITFTNTAGFRDQNDQSQGFGSSAPLSILFSMDPTAVNKLEDGSYNPQAGISPNISNPNLMLGQATGPRAETVNSDMIRSLTNVEAEVTLPYGFTAKTIFGYDYIDNKEREFWASESVNGAVHGGLGYRSNFTNKTLTSSSTLNYNRSFDKHNIRALVGYEVEARDLLYVSLSADKYSTDKLPELVSGQPRGASSSTYGANIMSYLANANYDFDNKYYFSGSFRRDGSSRLGVDNRWANFWSISGAWRISSEGFLEGNDLFSDLKLRLSYGTNGNLPTGFYSNLATYSFSAGYGDESAIFWGNAGNSKLGWEKSNSFNVGIDWTLFNRVSLSVEYYNKLTKDLLFSVPTTIVTGFSSNIQNLGKLKNTGVEISINSTNIQTRNFTWTTDFNLSFQSSKINTLPNGNDVMYGDGNMYLLREGESMHTFHLPQWLGVNSETGLGEFYIDPSLNNRDAVIDGQLVKDGNVTNYYSQASPTVVGKALPDMMGGITNSFRYKNFDLSFMISFQSGASLFDYTGYFLTFSDGMRLGSFNMNSEVAGNYWTKPGDNAIHPKPIYLNPYRSDRFSSRTIRSTDNIRMRDITLGYTIPISKRYVNNLRVFFKTSNPFMLYCATDNIDPDVDINGYRTTDTPATKSFIFGLNFEF
ncbi:TonB-dependent receptor [Bacteroides sp. 519]|uniref:SusC/RagA family TonB-linked outer membrane protein n=1 Tax=Bacteroides sp. 519 TaxID=2302937 RepID=UPI0013D77469|nr:TonB-dependent receptor [Bacteroides sp. 519]NDV59328.1 TonB-dependent receptor [Bacteroides sp. 519]